jgi:predicted  nucleic acid-binding Zn-ribbon protein
MLEAIEKLLILQDRDRKILRVQAELAQIDPERNSFANRLKEAQAAWEKAKLKVKQIETERKKLELDVEGKKQQIEKYSLQQFQTKKNEEYRALAHEIELCKKAIVGLEDQQLDLMEQGESAQKELNLAQQKAAETRKLVDDQTAALAQREQALGKQLAELQSDYARLTSGIEEGILARYQRLRKQKGANTVVGIDRSVCGGCHVKLPVQIVISCQAQQEVVSCPNCGRILYYAPHMDLVAAE